MQNYLLHTSCCILRAQVKGVFAQSYTKFSYSIELTLFERELHTETIFYLLCIFNFSVSLFTE